MQGEPADGIRLGAVFLVAGDGMADGSGMDADLVLAAALEGEFGLGIDVPAPVDKVQDLIVGDGQLAVPDFFRIGIDDQGLGVLHEPALDGAGLLLELVLKEGDIVAFDDEFLPAALEDVLGVLVLGEDHQAGGTLVQTVDDPDLGRGPVGRAAAGKVFLAAGPRRSLHVCVQDGVQGGFLLAGFALGPFGGGDRQQAGRLVGHHVVIVLKDDLHAGLFHFLTGVHAGFTGHGNGLGKDQEGVAGRQRMVEGRPLLPVHEDLSLGEEVLDAGLGLVGENLVQVFQEGTVMGDGEFLSRSSVHNSSISS